VLISGDEPIFPTASYRAGEQGTTGLEVCLNEKGRVTSARVSSSSGFARLDDSTLTWVKRARFRPATVDGRPEAVCGHRIDYVWEYEVLCGDSADTLKPCPRRVR
jgi:protein TonB